MVEVKFCGLTRAQDAEYAAELGASYAGVILASGPRLLDVPRARHVLAGLEGTSTRSVGVFGSQPPATIAWIADELALDVVQLHSGATLDRVLELRKWHEGEVWAVVGVSGAGLGDLGALAARVDALVLDTSIGGRTGGTGRVFDWSSAVHAVGAIRGETRIVVAGGLRPGIVADAVDALRPDVVDVSSGVESSPGIKDPGLMRAFAEAARSREE